MVSETLKTYGGKTYGGKTYGARAVLGVIATAALFAGLGAGSAKADGWYGDRRPSWDRGYADERAREEWRRHEWYEHHRYGYGGYYAPPHVYYAPPPPVYYAPRGYYPGSFNVTIPLR